MRRNSMRRNAIRYRFERVGKKVPKNDDNGDCGGGNGDDSLALKLVRQLGLRSQALIVITKFKQSICLK